MNIGSESLRLIGAAGIAIAYLSMCAAIWWRVRRQNQQAQASAAELAPARAGDAPLLLAYASQTGYAQELAWRTAQSLHTAGVAVQVLPLGQVSAETLAHAERALFVVSTYGEGDAPDTASRFVDKVMGHTLDLSQLQYAVLALGDASYVNFCGFGRHLDAWLAQQGATPMFERVEVDNAGAEALTRWQHQLSHVASVGDVPLWQAPVYEDWTLAARRQLNPGSAGQPVFHLELAPPAGVSAQWESGDLAQVLVPADPEHPREYSLGSIASDGRVHLLVRRHLRSDGGQGVASGWLTDTLAVGDPVALLLRAHRNFRLEDNMHRPLILIGNGTGLAGLRSHLKARAAAGQHANWLVFGERQLAHDFLYRDEILAWQAQGVLARTDLAFSRDQPERLYVQHRLLAAADALLDWVGRGAAIYVCGSLEGMAKGVDHTLRTLLGEATLRQLTEDGRYRRDVY